MHPFAVLQQNRIRRTAARANTQNRNLAGFPPEKGLRQFGERTKLVYRDSRRLVGLHPAGRNLTLAVAGIGHPLGLAIDDHLPDFLAGGRKPVGIADLLAAARQTSVYPPPLSR